MTLNVKPRFIPCRGLHRGANSTYLRRATMMLVVDAEWR